MLKTDLQVKKWKPVKGADRASCGDSLYLRGYNDGSRVFQFRTRGEWITLGHYPSLSLADARTMAILNKRLLKERKTTVEALKALATRASDAAELSKLAEITDTASPIPTFDQAYREWYALQVQANKWKNLSSRKRPIRAYEIHIEKHFGNLRIDKIRRPMIKKLMQRLLLSHPEIASKLLGYIWKAFEEAFDAELIDSNPCPRIKSFTVAEYDVHHALSLHFSRLPELWLWLEDAPFSQGVKMAMRLAVVTAHRPSVIANMRWKHFNCDNGMWTVPEKQKEVIEVGLMKSGREFSIKLPDSLAKAVCALPRECDYVFTVDGQKPINAETLRRNFQKFDEITSHGFRNTFKTWCLHQTPPIEFFLVERYVDHSLKGEDKAYRRTDLFDQRTELAERYFEYVRGNANDR